VKYHNVKYHNGELFYSVKYHNGELLYSVKYHNGELFYSVKYHNGELFCSVKYHNDKMTRVLIYVFYQDVHEIKFGADWQDALNSAVSSCEIFVPLVTARYGETLWTNREVEIHTL